MRISRRIFFGLVLLPSLVFTTAQGQTNDDDNAAGAVYTMSNAVESNKVLVFNRASDGTLSTADEYATGGLGSGGGLGNQGGLVLSKSGRWLFVVNAGSDQISVFAVRRDRLVLVDTVNSGGTQPVSVTVDRNLLYVLNAGSDNITGFEVGRHGRLVPLLGSTRPLSTSGTAPAQIEFSPDGQLLVVTEKATNRIDTYLVGEDGSTTGPLVHASVGATPFGFAFDRHGRLIVSEAAGGAFEASSVTSYNVAANGALQVISAAVPTTETAACWLIITRNGRFAYTTNTGSGSVSGFRIDRDGSLSLLDPNGRSGVTGDGSAPIDMALSRNSRFLYTLNSGNNTLSAFRVGANGTLH
ncbi:MAG: lactonase family protein, partial [Gammaproteobacteria bacterium]|nr:lactonase family protein [Gammaproteobacteria bacterium]